MQQPKARASKSNSTRSRVSLLYGALSLRGLLRRWAPSGLIASLISVQGVAEGAPDGTPCRDASECDTAFCVEGVCCNGGCTGTCESCLAELKQSGLDTGVCGATRAGTDPDNECEGTPPQSCGQI